MLTCYVKNASYSLMEDLVINSLWHDFSQEVNNLSISKTPVKENKLQNGVFFAFWSSDQLCGIIL